MRNVNICEAVKVAMEKGGYIARPYDTGWNDGAITIIAPTNTRDCCWGAIKMPDGEIRPAHKRWNPTAEDLMAEDWEVVTPAEI